MWRFSSRASLLTTRGRSSRIELRRQSSYDLLIKQSRRLTWLATHPEESEKDEDSTLQEADSTTAATDEPEQLSSHINQDPNDRILYGDAGGPLSGPSHARSRNNAHGQSAVIPESLSQSRTGHAGKENDDLSSISTARLMEELRERIRAGVPAQVIEMKFEKTRRHLEHILDYHFQQITWLQIALNDAKRQFVGLKKPTHSNRPLAILGDAVLRVVIVNQYVGADASSKEISNMLNRVSNASLSAFAQKHKLHELGTVPDDHPTAIEAIFGAVFKDSGHSFESVDRCARSFGLL
jgi:hypothetical protein